MEPRPLDEPNVVAFIGPPPILAPGEFAEHSFTDRIFGRRLEDVQADWTKIMDQISKIVAATSTRGIPRSSRSFALAMRIWRR